MDTKRGGFHSSQSISLTSRFGSRKEEDETRLTAFLVQLFQHLTDDLTHRLKSFDIILRLFKVLLQSLDFYPS